MAWIHRWPRTGTSHNIVSKGFRQLGKALPIDSNCDKELGWPGDRGLDSDKKGEAGGLGEGGGRAQGDPSRRAGFRAAWDGGDLAIEAASGDLVKHLRL